MQCKCIRLNKYYILTPSLLRSRSVAQSFGRSTLWSVPFAPRWVAHFDSCGIDRGKGKAFSFCHPFAHLRMGDVWL